MSIVTAILLFLVGWLAHMAYTSHQDLKKDIAALAEAQRKAASRKPMKAEDIPWGKPCGYQFDDAPDKSVNDVRESESMSSARDWIGGSESPTRTNPPFSAN